MEKRCKKCAQQFQPDYPTQVNCVTCKEYNLQSKQKSREKEKAEREAKKVPNASAYKIPAAYEQKLAENRTQILKTVRAELQTFTTPDEYVVEAIADVLLGLENGYAQKVCLDESSTGMLVGGHFPEAVASTAVEHVHRSPNLLGSAKFKAMYDKFLRAVVAWDGKFQYRYSSPELMVDVKEELAGVYKLKSEKAPAVPAPIPVESPQELPSDEEIRQRGRVQLFRQLQRDLPTEALRYLDSGTF